MKPFVLLATRAEDLPADEEYALFRRFTGLREDELIRVRLESSPMPELDLTELSGIFVGGGPFNASDPESTKSTTQRRVEAEFSALLDRVVAQDFPFLGACYGVGTVGLHQGALIDATHKEPISVIDVQRTPEGAVDPLLEGIPDEFTAFVGHKEAVARLPKNATLLARGDACPVQMFRIGENVYATQFHPEVDLDGMTTRIHAYADYGYFLPEEKQATLEAVRRAPVEHTAKILRTFAQRYARS